QVKKVLGKITIDDQGGFEVDVPEDEFVKLLMELSQDSNIKYDGEGKNKKLLLTTRSVTDEESAIRYMNNVLAYKPKNVGGGEFFSARSFIASASAQMESEVDIDLEDDEPSDGQDSGAMPAPRRR